MTSTIAEQLQANAVADGDGIWITSPDSNATVSWSEAAAHSRNVACHLDALGVEAGASVAVASPVAEGSVSSPQATSTSAGHDVKVGAMLSVTVMV